MGPSLVGMRAAVAIATAFSLALAPVAPSLAAQGSPAPKPTAAPPSRPRRSRRPGTAAAAPAATAPTPAPPDGGWPRAYTTPSGGKIVVYQPQVASWDEPEAHGRLRGGVLRGQGRARSRRWAA